VGLALFVGRNIGDCKKDFVQFAALHGCASDCNVPAMHGIKRSTEESDIHKWVLSPLVSRFPREDAS
jgi:hypothetical protein